MKEIKNNKSAKSAQQKRIRRAFAELRETLAVSADGDIPAPGLGIFMVRTVTKEKDGQPVTRKRITLRLKKPGKAPQSIPLGPPLSD
jgi:hypothetical protein